MPLFVPSLYETCLDATVKLLQSSYWDTNFPLDYNPFAYLPSLIVDALVQRVVKQKYRGSLKSSDLRLLLTSGKVRNFELVSVNVNEENLQEILRDLSTACRYLQKIKLKYLLNNSTFCTMGKKSDLNTLLREAHNLKHIESTIEFDLYALVNCRNLECLIVNFLVSYYVFDFLEVDGKFVPHPSLKHIQLLEDNRYLDNELVIAVLLNYCPELLSIDCDVSKSLEYLHTEELYNGTITAKYKLEQCHLGNLYALASKDAAYIASLTCPHLKDINMLVNDHQAIYALRELRNLKSLRVQWEKMEYCDYICGMQFLLETPEIGLNLTHLYIFNFTNVDFSSIGECCPNLETLHVEYEYENNRKAFSSMSFRKLKLLILTKAEGRNCGTGTLIGLLSNATNLRRFCIRYAGGLTDEVVTDILGKNSLSKVTEFYIERCVLSVEAVTRLVASMTSLKYLEFSQSRLWHVKHVDAVYKINPQIKVIYRF